MRKITTRLDFVTHLMDCKVSFILKHNIAFVLIGPDRESSVRSPVLVIGVTALSAVKGKFCYRTGFIVSCKYGTCVGYAAESSRMRD